MKLPIYTAALTDEPALLKDRYPMGYTQEKLKAIHAKTRGKCHICHTRRNLGDYGLPEDECGWEVEHSVPRSKGGTDHLNNLYLACTECNRLKGTRHTRTCRNEHGLKRAPMSHAKLKKAKAANTWGGLGIGGVIGLIGGPVGVVIGAAAGAALGSWINPEAD